MSENEKSEDRMLITHAKEGDTEAFESLVKKYQRNIYLLCHRMTGAHQAADDLSQDTFIKAFFSLNTFKDGMNFFTWIRKIAVNTSLNFLRIRKREKPLGDNDAYVTSNPYSSSQDSPPEQLQKNRMQEKFKTALKSLPSDQKTIFILRVYEDLSYKDISELLNIPQGTVMSRLSRARRKLQRELADYLEGGVS